MTRLVRIRDVPEDVHRILEAPRLRRMTVVDSSIVVDYLLLRDNCTIGDGLFAALAQLLEEQLMTVDRRLAAAARDHAGVAVVEPA